MLVDLSPRLPQLGFQPLDPALHRGNIDFLLDRWKGIEVRRSARIDDGELTEIESAKACS
jgi:hypothetical protein